MKLVLFVEGQTEKKALAEFLKRWLDPSLPRPVRITPVRFDGWGHYTEEIAKKVELNLTGKAGADAVGAIGLLDLHGLGIFPDGVTTPAKRYDWAKDHFERKVGHPRFRQHLAVHETEAWLLGAPDVLPHEVRRALPKKCERPEEVDFDEPPSALLGRLYRQKLNRSYKKVIDGSNLFQRLEPDAACQRCPYLKRLLDDMQALALATR